MLFSLEVLPAAEGDCLLLHSGTLAKPQLSLIDGGPAGVYSRTLQPRLKAIAKNPNLSPLVLRLVMVSHMDNDHIVGVKNLFSDVHRSLGHPSRIAKVERLWLNVFNDVIGDATDQYYRKLTASLETSIGGKPNPKLVEELAAKFCERHGDDDDEAQFEATAMAAVLAGHADGRALRTDYEFLHDQNDIRRLNHPFSLPDGTATLITLDKTPTPRSVAGAAFTIIGPMQEQIDRLQKEFDEFLVSKGGANNEAALLAAYADKSAKNLSSIVCLAEVDDPKKRILFTGDARGDLILEGLERQKLLDGDGKLFVDILKVPHHGSNRNVEREFFEKIVANTYVLSGDGKHGNPERETIQWIVEARRENTKKFDIVLTYDVATIDTGRKTDWEMKQKRKAPEKRLPWNHERQALTVLLDDLNDRVLNVQTGAPIVIDLGDEKVNY